MSLSRAARVTAPITLAAWYGLTRNEGEIAGLPTLVLWAMAVAAIGLGFVVRRRTASPWRHGGALLAAIVAGATIGGATMVTGPASLQTAAATGMLGAGAAGIGAALSDFGRWPRAGDAFLVFQALAMWCVVDLASVLEDVHVIGGELQIFLFYDTHVYLAAGRNHLAGDPVYLTGVMTELPPTTHEEPFLYPPLLLPVVAVLASLPREVAIGAVVLAVSAAAALAGRLLGLGWAWALLFVLYPPVFKGILSGNIAHLGLLALAAAPLVGAVLVLGAVVKVQNLILPLWLARERRWRELGVGVGLIGVLVVLTLPLVGVESWVAYGRGLGFRESTQRVLPELYGLSLAGVLPVAVFAGVALGAVALALLPAGRRSLALLGVASIVASPSLWPHGFAMALPAVLSLRPPYLWLVLGIAISGVELWVLVIAGVAAALAGWGRRRPFDPGDPLAGTGGPWSRPAASPGPP